MSLSTSTTRSSSVRLYLRHGITLAADACVFDVGANIGLFSLLAADRCPRGVIHAFEPVAALCSTLRRNVADTARVQVWEVGWPTSTAKPPSPSTPTPR